jgi:hypothetical protein
MLHPKQSRGSLDLCERILSEVTKIEGIRVEVLPFINEYMLAVCP